MPAYVINTPLWVAQYVQQQFNSSSQMTMDGQVWIDNSRRWLRKFVKDIGGTEFKFRPGHYEWYCNFKLGDQWWYCMSGDVRFKVCGWMLLRKCKGPKDYTGGVNQRVPYDNNFEQTMRRILGLT